MVEHAIGHLKENRAVATRFGKLNVNSLATVDLALIRHALRTRFRQTVSREFQMKL